MIFFILSTIGKQAKSNRMVFQYNHKIFIHFVKGWIIKKLRFICKPNKMVQGKLYRYICMNIYILRFKWGKMTHIPVI